MNNPLLAILVFPLFIEDSESEYENYKNWNYKYL